MRRLATEAPSLSVTRYRPIFHLCESGMSMEHMDAIRKESKVCLPPLLKGFLAAAQELLADTVPLCRPALVVQQELFGELMLRMRGGVCLDPSPHPYAGRA